MFCSYLVRTRTFTQLSDGDFVSFCGTNTLLLLVVGALQHNFCLPRSLTLRPVTLHSALGSDGSFSFAAYATKIVLHIVALHRSHESSPRLIGHGSRQDSESVRSTKLSLKVLAAKFEDQRWAFSRSCVRRGSLTHFRSHFLLIGKDLLLGIAKK